MLLDSNIIIYSSQPAHKKLRGFIRQNNPFLCWINYVEVLGYNKLTVEDKLYFENLFKASVMLEIDFDIIVMATTIRQSSKISLGDSLIAATALNNNMPLVTRNTSDFKNVKGLKLLDPFSL